MTLSGSASATTATDGSGNYSFTGLAAGGTYTVTPNKAPVAPASAGINTVDVLGIQRHFLLISVIPPGCRLTAADVNLNGSVNTQDVVAVQRFFLGFTSATASTGQYKFTPTSLTYPTLGTNQTGQNYAMLVLGDVAGPFVNRSGGVSPDQAMENDLGISTVAAIILPDLTITRASSSRTQTAPVTTSTIDARENLVGFQGDFTFDERVVRFETEPVQKAGLTSGNWNVAGHVLDGPGPIRTLRISAYSNEFVPLSGSGTLFELRVVPGSNAGTTPLRWSSRPDDFVFIDADLKTQRPASAAAGKLQFSIR